jgi:cyclase
MKKITDNVYFETGYQGCNTGFVITSQGIVMIDSPMGIDDNDKHIKIIRQQGNAVYLINTEPHIDHIAGNAFYEAVGIAQEETREEMKKQTTEQFHQMLGFIQPKSKPRINEYELCLPSITFGKSMKLYLGNHTFELFHLPGHSSSQTAVYIPQEKVVFTGDNIFYQTKTFLHSCLAKEWLASLRFLKQLDAAVFLPGHGEECPKAYLDEQESIIQKWIETIQDAVKQGWTLEQAQEKIIDPDPYPMEESTQKGLGPELNKMNITRLFTLARENRL